MDGQDLTPEDGLVNVQVTVIAPDDKNKEFTGYVRVENTENTADFGLIPVNLQTPKDAGFIGSVFLTWFFERFPHAFPLVRHLLGYE
jgi:pectin methylesterase-like acyl-CoA thioesterase